MRSGRCDLAMVGEEAERPGRLTEKQIKAIVDLWRTGLGIGEIEKLTGAGRATIHHYVKDVPRFDTDRPMGEKNETVAPSLPQIIDLPSKERCTPRPPSSVPAQVDLGMGVVVDLELIAILRGFAAQEGYRDFNGYLRDRLIPWAGAVKDLCPNERPQQFFEKMTKVHNDLAEAYRLLSEEKQRNRWPAGREYLIKNLQLLGWTPEQIQREIGSIDEIARRTRAFSN